MFMRKVCLVFFTALSLAGCSAHSPFILTNTTDSEPVDTSKFTPHTERVFVTKQPLPSDIDYDFVSTIEVGKIWYGSAGNVLESIGERARELGANAVIDVKTWHQPSGFSWAAPHGSGRAIVVNDMEKFKSSGIVGSWY